MNEETNPPLPESSQPSAEPGSHLAPLEGESPPAYEAFIYYFEMPLPRSLRRAANELGGSLNTFEDWSVKYHWRKRIQDYRASLANKRAQAEAGAMQRQEMAAQISLHMLESSSRLLDQQLLHGAEKIPVPVILRMMQVSDDLARPRRGERGTALAGSNHESLRKQLMAVGEYARKEREKETASSSANGHAPLPEPPSSDASPAPTDPSQITKTDN